MTQPVSPIPDPPTPIPSPPPVSPGQKWYTSFAYLSWIGQQLVALAVLVGTLLGHPFDSTVVTAAVSTAAMLVSGITTGIFVHGQQKIALSKLAHTQGLQYLHYEARLAQQGLHPYASQGAAA